MATASPKRLPKGDGPMTLTPQDSRVGMCSFRDASSSGLPSTNRKAPSSRFQSSRRTRGPMSVTSLSVRWSDRRPDRPASGLRSDTALPSRFRNSRFARRPSGRRSDTRLLLSLRNTKSDSSPSAPMSARSLSSRSRLQRADRPPERAAVGDRVAAQVQIAEPGKTAERTDVGHAVVSPGRAIGGRTGRATATGPWPGCPAGPATGVREIRPAPTGRRCPGRRSSETTAPATAAAWPRRRASPRCR